jgi:cation transport ATPase
MNSIEDLQAAWKSQDVRLPAVPENLEQEVKDQWQQRQKKVLWRNIGTSLAFGVVYYVFYRVYRSYHTDHSIFFGASILFTSLLMAVYLWALWRGLLYAVVDMGFSNRAYLERLLKKLRWQRFTITHLSVAYSLLLWISMMFYCWDVTRQGSLLFRWTAALLITAYILGVAILTRKTRQKKQIRQIDSLIEKLQQIKDGLF